ncbi:MAG: hypothetical protein IT308_13360 [Anaerolineaceae bacterium]|nr:hypothetical protein [Anaerolineaceae bacterium]
MQRTNLFLRDLKNFTAFLGNLWGGLAALSVLLPLINGLARVIPLHSFKEDGILIWFTPQLFTAIAILISLSLLLTLYRARHVFLLQANLDRLYNLAWKSFGLGITLLVVYLAFYFFLHSNLIGGAPIGISEGRRLMIEAGLMFLYAGSFAMITRGFALLAMGEFLSR